MARGTIDHSLAIACIGYGALRAMREHSTTAFATASPVSFILEEKDPVGFCIDAMSRIHPEWVSELGTASRGYIRERLVHEARRAGVTAGH
jgi:hypothetical protein